MNKSKIYLKVEAGLFIMPALLLVFAFIVVPIILTLDLSIRNDAGEIVWFENFQKLFKDTRIINLSGLIDGFPWGALLHNILWLILHVPLSMAVGLLFAVLTHSFSTSSSRFLQTSIFLGMVTPMIIGGVLVRNLFSESVGTISNLMAQLGLEKLGGTWTNNPNLAFFALIFVHIWLWSGYTLVVYLAGISGIPKSYYEAATIDGVSGFKAFRYITLPLLKPATSIAFIMTVLSDLKTFDLVFAATGGAPGGATTVLALEMYYSSFRFQEYSRGAAIATLLTILAFSPIFRSVKKSLGSER